MILPSSYAAEALHHAYWYHSVDFDGAEWASSPNERYAAHVAAVRARQAERARRFEQQLAARGLRAIRADEAVGDFASLPYNRLLDGELREPMPGWITPDGAD